MNEMRDASWLGRDGDYIELIDHPAFRGNYYAFPVVLTTWPGTKDLVQAVQEPEDYAPERGYQIRYIPLAHGCEP